MNAIGVLAAQHRAIETLFDEVENEPRRHARTRHVSRIAEELIAHMAGEEAVFYPALQRVVKDGGTGARAEHVELRVQLRRLLRTRASDDGFLDRIRVLRNLFGKHVLEEETRVFPRLERALSPSENAVLGEEILASRPPIWMVTSERGEHMHADDPILRSRVTLPIPPAHD